ncbi:MAG: hypothetical protein HUU21_09055 [Polyangiaceae bacterium]|nr:hypothetical protein [Polyangiaceae bacterium]NUQ73689.1 hypothetical protein [Polyangiaceae bacterium]
MYFRLDQLGKNVLRDFFVLVGAVETEVEVPPGDAQRIDLWHVPNPDLLQAHPEIEPGLLRSMAAEPGMVEVWSATPDTADFHECIRKHRQWHHTLELRTGSRIPLPSAWLVSAGRPRRVEFPWLVRLSFEVPAEVVARLPADERDFIMETR